MATRRPLVMIDGKRRQLPAGDSLPGAAPVDALTITYNADGTVDTVTEDSVTTTITYNTDGTVHTVSYPHGGLTRTETYSYNPDGSVSGMNAEEV